MKDKNHAELLLKLAKRDLNALQGMIESFYKAVLERVKNN